MEALVAPEAYSGSYLVHNEPSLELSLFSGPLRLAIPLAVSYLTGSDFRSTEVLE
jgi:hypothetical protein